MSYVKVWGEDGDKEMWVDVYSEDVLNKMEISEIQAYLNRRQGEFYTEENLVNDFIHGDFDLKKLLHKIGRSQVL